MQLLLGSGQLHAAAAASTSSTAAAAGDTAAALAAAAAVAAAEAAEIEPRYFARVKHVRDFPSVSVVRLLQQLQQQQQQQVLLQQWQAEASSSEAQAISLLKRRLELLRLLQQLQQPEQQQRLLQQLPLLQPHEIVALLLRLTANIETLRDSLPTRMQQQQQQEVVQQQQQLLLQQWAEWRRCAEQLTRLAIDEEEALLIWTAMNSIRAFSSSSSSSHCSNSNCSNSDSSSSNVLRALLLQVRERLEAAVIASNARSRQPQHPCLCLWDTPAQGFLGLVEAAPLGAKAALVAAEELYDSATRGLLPPKPPAPPPRSWRSMDPVDMETWESSQRRVVRTRWLPQPSGVFFQGRKLAAALVLHLHQVLQQQQQQQQQQHAAPVASPASLADICVFLAKRDFQRTSFHTDTVNALAARIQSSSAKESSALAAAVPLGEIFNCITAFSSEVEQLLTLEASSLIPWLPSFVQLLRLQFALQRELAIHLAAAAEQLLQQQHKQQQQQQQQQQTTAIDLLVQQTLRDGDPGLLAKMHPLVLTPLLLLQICGGLLAAQTYEMPLALALKFFAKLRDALQRAAAFRSSSSSNSSNSSSSSVLLPLRDVAFFCSVLKRSGLHDEKIVRQLLLQVQHDLLQRAGPRPAANAATAPAAAAAAAAYPNSSGVEAQQGAAGQATAPAVAPATAAKSAGAEAAAAATAAATAAEATAADAKQQIAAAEGSVADLCAILDAAAFSCRSPAAAAVSPAAASDTAAAPSDTAAPAAAAATAEAAAARGEDFDGLFEAVWRLLLPLRLELSPSCGLMVLNAMEAAGPTALRDEQGYRELRQHFLSAHADLDPEALGSLSL
ncbi:hypothetical protein Emag_001215 [Eimeria magna]